MQIKQAFVIGATPIIAEKFVRLISRVPVEKISIKSLETPYLVVYNRCKPLDMG